MLQLTFVKQNYLYNNAILYVGEPNGREEKFNLRLYASFICPLFSSPCLLYEWENMKFEFLLVGIIFLLFGFSVSGFIEDNEDI